MFLLKSLLKQIYKPTGPTFDAVFSALEPMIAHYMIGKMPTNPFPRCVLRTSLQKPFMLCTLVQRYYFFQCGVTNGFTPNNDAHFAQYLLFFINVFQFF